MVPLLLLIVIGFDDEDFERDSQALFGAIFSLCCLFAIWTAARGLRDADSIVLDKNGIRVNLRDDKFYDWKDVTHVRLEGEETDTVVFDLVGSPERNAHDFDVSLRFSFGLSHRGLVRLIKEWQAKALADA